MRLRVCPETICRGEYESIAAPCFLRFMQRANRLPGSCSVSASVKSSQRPRACCAAAQQALFLPVNAFGIELQAERQDAGSRGLPAKGFRSRAIAVRSVEPSSTTRSSQSRPSAKAARGVILRKQGGKAAGQHCCSFRAGKMTESS